MASCDTQATLGSIYEKASKALRPLSWPGCGKSVPGPFVGYSLTFARNVAVIAAKTVTKQGQLMQLVI
jgi:hypothetical protein